MIAGSARSMGLEVVEYEPWPSTASALPRPTTASTATRVYTVDDAVKLVKARATAKFDETDRDRA